MATNSLLAHTLISRPIIVVPDLAPRDRPSDDTDLSADGFLRHLLALGSVFVAGYLWLLIGA